MKKYLLLTAIVVLLAYVILPRTASRVNASAEEYAVYSAVIANMFDGERVTFDTGAKIKLLVIQDVTATDPTTRDDSRQDDQYFRRMFSTLTEGVAKDYRAKNNKPVRLVDSFGFIVKHVLVDKQEVDKIFIGGGSWEEFYKRYPDSGGFIILSRVGFNAAMNQALVYIQHGCGGLCGTGHYVLLEKSVDRWRVVNRNMVWIS